MSFLLINIKKHQYGEYALKKIWEIKCLSSYIFLSTFAKNKGNETIGWDIYCVKLYKNI